MTWRDFWNHNHSIYVNARHKALHYAGIAKDLAPLIPSPQAIVLDYGCGEALAAPQLAARCNKLYLFDGASNVEASLRQRYGGSDKIIVLSESSLRELPDGALDMIICNSVLQYLSQDECRDFVQLAWHKLKVGGSLVVADVIPPYVDAAADTMALLEFASRGGFLFAALRGLVATYFSRYRKLRAEVGLTTFAIPDMQRLLSTNGFEAKRLNRNIGHNQARMTFLAKRV
ncbi:MAG: class I SAM-dependent methyltransferase [Beijerinckiaceae bacterium]